ncbi:hypothetical protein FQN50_007875 [Emmonsiellopsis sp. PD_5]|nr:hypothetical protein FQN50_007875 [Emmonsiellopsis sp. PD_5]
MLGGLHQPTLQATKRIYPPPDPGLTFAAGFAAGTIQSIVAAPLDALQVRFRTKYVLKGQYRNVWQYGKHKLHEIGIRGIFSGWGLSFLKDAFGSALFFGVFETIKAQGYYSFVTFYYGSLHPALVEKLSSQDRSSSDVPSIRPHYALEPCFLMLAGITASAAQQLVQHPLTIMQNVYYERLDHIDRMARLDHSGRKMMEHHYQAYQELYRRCQRRALRAGGWRTWLFKGFFGNAVRQVPSTSAGLIIFELVRRKYGVDAETVHIRQDGVSTVIPLRSLDPNSRPSSDPSSSLLDSSREKEGNRRSSSSSPPSTPSTDSNFSVWSDTGDLAEQLADEEDPLQIHLRRSLDRQVLGRAGSRSHRRSSKRVHYSKEETRENDDGGLVKEIQIPNPPPRTISRTERTLAAIMSPGDRRKARSKGLVGKPLLYFTSVFVSLGVFLFGYDQGVMSGIITGAYFKDYFGQPTKAEIGTMVAILEVGAFISSLMVGRLGDIIGRRRTILYGSMVFFVGGAFQTCATGIPMMLVGRIIAGLGVGALSTIVPVYQSEISPPHNRGKLACIEFTGNICGYAASVWVDYFCSYIPNNWAWRLPLLCQCIMGALLGVGALIICESPRWLLDNDYDEEGMVVIANLYGEGDIHNEKARQEYRDIKMGVLIQRQEGERTYTEMFRRYYKRVFIAMSAQALAQLNGINVISYYAPLVFESAGWMGRQAILMTGTSGVRLEDMDAIFGDATTAMPTPATPAERDALMGVGSPVPSLDIRRSHEAHSAAEYAIPGLDINPPNIDNNKNQSSPSGHEGRSGRSGGFSGWISNMVGRGRGSGDKGDQGRYSRLDQEEEG